VDELEWINELLNGLRDQAPARSDEERARVERWIGEQIEQLRGEQDIE
jgi:hypothetical protein